MSKRLKTFIIIIIVVIVAIVAVSIFSNKGTLPAKQGSSPLSSSTGVIPLPGAGASTSADEFSTLLSSINRISIDTSIFDNDAYKKLRDFPVSLGTDIIGRTNPFAPIGSDSDSGTPQTLTVSTLQSGKVTSTTAEFGAQISLADTVPTNVVFEYGTSDTFGSVTTPIVVTKTGTVLTTATKLTPETTYFVRAVAVRGSLTLTGDTTSFTTTKK